MLKQGWSFFFLVFGVKRGTIDVMVVTDVALSSYTIIPVGLFAVVLLVMSLMVIVVMGTVVFGSISGTLSDSMASLVSE